MDACEALDQSAIDPVFIEKNKLTFNTKRGGGLWLWKPVGFLVSFFHLACVDFLSRA